MKEYQVERVWRDLRLNRIGARGFIPAPRPSRFAADAIVTTAGTGEVHLGIGYALDSVYLAETGTTAASAKVRLAGL